MANRVQKIRQHGNVTWHHVPTAENPADIGNRGGKVSGNTVWKEGPSWLSNPAEWPVQRVLEPTPDSKSKAKVIKEIFNAAHIEEDVLDPLLDKYPLPKVLRIGAWVRRFILNCKRQPAERERERSVPSTVASSTTTRMVDTTGPRRSEARCTISSRPRTIKPSGEQPRNSGV